MAVAQEELTPSSNGQGTIGTALKKWGLGHFANLFKNGKEVAELDSPALINNPTAPTQSAGDNSTKLATTAYADTSSAAAQSAAVQRSNHTGTQAASTISDFSAAVAATNAGTKAHTQNTDTSLDLGGSNPVTAAAIVAHQADAAKHREIDDTAGNGDTDKLWSADKIYDHVSSEIAAISSDITLSNVTDSGALAAKNTVTTADIDLESITASRLSGGPSDNDPGNTKYYGTNGAGGFGFHDLPTPALTDGSVTTAKIASLAVTTDKVEGGSGLPGNTRYWGTNASGTVGFHPAANPDSVLAPSSAIVYYGSTNPADFKSDVTTVDKAVGARAQFIDDDLNPEVLRNYILESGTTAESLPDIVRGDDFHATTNAKFWRLVHEDRSRNAVQSDGSVAITGLQAVAALRFTGTDTTTINSSAIGVQTGATLVTVSAEAGTTGTFDEVNGTFQLYQVLLLRSASGHTIQIDGGASFPDALDGKILPQAGQGWLMVVYGGSEWEPVNGIGI